MTDHANIPVAATEENELRSLVTKFADALLAKLIASEQKNGWGGAWRDPNWREDLIIQLKRHVEKGDPRDVAAYCAFAFYHGWSLTSAQCDRPTDSPFEEPVRHADESLEDFQFRKICWLEGQVAVLSRTVPVKRAEAIACDSAEG